MTDITELALIAKIKKQTENFDTVVLKEWEALALVEALEKAQQRIGKLEKKITDHKRMNQEMAKAMLTPNDSDAAGMEIAALRQRIAELESRTVTVKLASRRLPSDYVDGEFGNDDLAAIHNACRLECKVSVEKYLSAHGIVVKWEDE
ncbi:hypothetical protein ACLHXR_11780 [Klebsiella quasipneumoniae]|uniref:hypothetical protein n=1 Tax=Klebsiella quasipneumoniae TaxID=1463165 RepID=UPI003983071F